MKERLLQLLDLEHLTPSKFADLIGVQRSSVSHILSDRNKPSYDFLQKTLKTFPGLKADWLMLGEGPMYEQMGRESGDLFNQNLSQSPVEHASNQEDFPEVGPSAEDESDADDSDNQEISQELSVNRPPRSGKLVQVMLFYDDDTFHTHRPSQ